MMTSLLAPKLYPKKTTVLALKVIVYRGPNVHVKWWRTLQAARLNRAKEAAARSWRSTLSSGDNQDEDMPPSQAPSQPKKEEKPHPKGEDQPRPLPPPQGWEDVMVKPVIGADRAKLVKDFQQRRREAAANRQRGDAQWMRAEYSPRPLPKAPEISGK